MTDYVLRYRRPDETWKEIQLTSDITIGSSAANTIVITDPGVVDQHALITIQPDGIYVTDLGSSQGTKLEGKNLTPNVAQIFPANQTIFIGEHTITLIETKPVTALASPPPPPQSEKSLPEKLTSSNKITAWIMSNALLVGGITLVVAVIIIISVATIIGSRQSYATQIDETATVLAEHVESGEKPLQESTPVSSEPGKPTPTFGPAAKPTASNSANEIEITPPGAGIIQIDPITLISNGTIINNLLGAVTAISSGKPLDLQTQITGEKIGFVFTYVGYNKKMPDNSTALVTAERKYITAEKVKEIEGIQYPDFGSGTIPIKYAWQPTLYYLSDGENRDMALVYPVDYRSSYDNDASYVTDGIYTFSQSGEERYAKVYFSKDGNMRNIVGYKSVGDFKGAPFDINPETGDTFTILLEKFEFDEPQSEEGTKPAMTLPTGLPGGIENILPSQSGKMPYGKGRFVSIKGATLKYHQQPFTWKAEKAPPGDYYAGLVAQDMDGNYYAAYVPVKIK